MKSIEISVGLEKGEKNNNRHIEIFPHLPSNLPSLTKCTEKISNKFLDKIFQGRTSMYYIQKHTNPRLEKIFPWKERKKLNSYVKQNQFRFFCSFLLFLLFFFVCSISLLPFSNIIIKTFVSTQKNTTDWTRLAIVINNHRSPHKSDKKYEQGTSHRFVRQQKKNNETGQ